MRLQSLVLGLALVALLAMAAPLVHAHFDATPLAAEGLCGEHGDEPASPPSPEPCSVCVASGHRSAASARVVAGTLRTPPLAGRVATDPPSLPCAASATRPGGPRAPPTLV